LKSLSLEYSDSEDAELWVKSKLGLEFSVPNAAFAGYELQGADGFERRGRKYAYLKYQEDGKTIGDIIFKDKGFSLDLPETVNIVKIKIQMGKMKETNIAVWKKGGLVYLILTFEDKGDTTLKTSAFEQRAKFNEGAQAFESKTAKLVDVSKSGDFNASKAPNSSAPSRRQVSPRANSQAANYSENPYSQTIQQAI
jgi:hypothetical protein